MNKIDLRIIVNYIGILSVLLIFGSCNNLKYIPEGDSLYLGSTIKIEDDAASTTERKVLQSDLEEAIDPRPNKKFLGARIKLSLYNFIDTPKKEKGLRHWLRTKVGEPPVLGSTFNEEMNRNLLLNMLQNRGFFRAKIYAEKEIKDKKSYGRFTIRTGSQGIIDSVDFTQPNATLFGREIYLSGKKTLLKKGQPYNLDLIKGERERIDRHLKEKGYYFFRPEYIFLEVDTTLPENKVWAKVLHREDEMPEQALKRYRINNITIYPNYTIERDYRDTSKLIKEFYKGYYVIQKEKEYKPSLFVNTMIFEPGEVYNRTDQNVTLSRIGSLGAFKFAKNSFKVVPDTITPLLDVTYYLTSSPKKSLSFDVGALTRSDSRVGSEATVSWRNRNTFKGSELWTVRANGGFEMQYGSKNVAKRPNTYTYGIESSLAFPRFVVPFIKIPTKGPFIPRTVVKGSFNQVLRSGAYKITSVQGNFGYNWKEEIRKEHALYPINLNFVRTDTVLRNTTFNDYNFSNVVFNGIIIGPTYEYTFNSQNAVSRKNNFYFNGLADLSANILGLVQQADYETNRKKIFDNPYAQYVKLQSDLRHYLKLSPTKGNMLASRLFVGVGIPYGNSNNLPNIKQYFSGGNSSLRGFRSRLMGPGTYHNDPKNNAGKNTYIEMLGDIKLEINTEARLDLYQFVKGAIFIDAGNIWLKNKNSNFPGGEFTKNFYKEIAVNTGLGLRFDFSIIMLRFDLGLPLRKPWLPEGERWVINKMKFSDGQWRAENLIFNIAIGYPF